MLRLGLSKNFCCAGVPMNLPPCAVAPENLNTHYSLPKQLKSTKQIHSQMSAMQKWCRERIQLDRIAQPITLATWENIESTIYIYLGYLYIHEGVKQAKLGLECFLDLGQFSRFMSFQLQKRKSSHSLTQIFSHCNKVLNFLIRQSCNPAIQLVHKCEVASAWMSRLRKQLSHHVHKTKKDVGNLQAANRWIDAPELVALIQSYTNSVMAKLPSRGAYSYLQARDLHDICLLACMFGHLPPIRLVCLRTLQVLDAPKCLVEDCPRTWCRGNMLELQPGGALNMVFSHYKVDEK